MGNTVSETSDFLPINLLISVSEFTTEFRYPVSDICQKIEGIIEVKLFIQIVKRFRALTVFRVKFYLYVNSAITHRGLRLRLAYFNIASITLQIISDSFLPALFRSSSILSRSSFVSSQSNCAEKNSA